MLPTCTVYNLIATVTVSNIGSTTVGVHRYSRTVAEDFSSSVRFGEKHPHFMWKGGATSVYRRPVLNITFGYLFSPRDSCTSSHRQVYFWTHRGTTHTSRKFVRLYFCGTWECTLQITKNNTYQLLFYTYYVFWWMLPNSFDALNWNETLIGVKNL